MISLSITFLKNICETISELIERQLDATPVNGTPIPYKGWAEIRFMLN